MDDLPFLLLLLAIESRVRHLRHIWANRKSHRMLINSWW
jgi:hypothetical protein